MDENQNEDMNMPKAGKPQKSVGPAIGIIIIIIVVILAGLYFFGGIAGRDEGGVYDAQDADGLSDSDAVEDIEGDLGATDVDNLDEELGDLDAEFDALEQELNNL